MSMTWFKSLTVYKFADVFDITPQALHPKLARKRFSPCAPDVKASVGWVAPIGAEDGDLIAECAGVLLMCLQAETRRIPAEALRQTLAERVQEIERREARTVSRTERYVLAEQITRDLLPTTWPKRTRVYAYIDPQRGWLVVGTAPGNRADEVVQLLRLTGAIAIEGQYAVGLCPPVKRLRTYKPEAATLSSWLIDCDLMPDDFELGECVELCEPGGSVARVRFSRQDLTSADVRAALESGKLVTRLELEYQHRLRCLIGDDFSIRRLQWLEFVHDELHDVIDVLPVNVDDPDTERDSQFEAAATFSVQIGQIDALIQSLLLAFGE